MVDANTIFNSKEICEIEELIDINKQIKELETRKKELNDKLKDNMKSLNVSNFTLNGSSFSLIETQRRTVTKATKDKFIAELVGLNKQYLLTTSIEPDLDSIFSEVDAGTLDKDLVNKYVKVSDVTTLRCN